MCCNFIYPLKLSRIFSYFDALSKNFHHLNFVSKCPVMLHIHWSFPNLLLFWRFIKKCPYHHQIRKAFLYYSCSGIVAIPITILEYFKFLCLNMFVHWSFPVFSLMLTLYRKMCVITIGYEKLYFTPQL